MRKMGSLLKCTHIHDNNGKSDQHLMPFYGTIDWKAYIDVMREIGYDGTVCMEPFVKMGGQVGQDIRIWHNMYDDLSEPKLDKDAADALKFQRYMFDGLV